MNVVTKGTSETCCCKIQRTTDVRGQYTFTLQRNRTLGTDYPVVPKVAPSKLGVANFYLQVSYTFYELNQAFSMEIKFQEYKRWQEYYTERDIPRFIST